MADFTTAVAEFRRRRFALAEGDRIHSTEEALEFLKLAGYCLLTPKAGMTLPNLADIAGEPFRRWKDEIIRRKAIYYGRPFRRRSGFVRLDLLPSLYALSPTAAFEGDRFELYKRRFLSADANRIAGVVFAKGPLPTRALRRESGMAGHQHHYRFLRRLAEAETQFLIVKSGITTIEASHYSYLWEPFTAVYSSSAAASADISVDEAATTVITSYLDAVGAATIRQITLTFTLNEDYVRYMAGQLVEQRRIARHSGEDREYLICWELDSAL